MMQILGQDSAAKRQFVYSLATLAAIHYGKYEMYSEHYAGQAEDYTDALTVYPLRDYRGQEQCLVETELPVVQAEQTVCYLTPYRPEIQAFLEYLAREKPEKITVVYGSHIRESALNQKFDKLLADEALFDGYYQLEPLSGDYKNALLRLLEQVAGVLPRQSKKYFGQERRLRP